MANILSISNRTCGKADSIVNPFKPDHDTGIEEVESDVEKVSKA